MSLSPYPLGQSPSSSSLPGQFSVSTWNVWFDKHHREERFAGLLDALRPLAPEIMGFQEVTLPFVRALQEAEWLQQQGYWLSAVDPNNLGAVLVSRLQPLSVGWVTLPTAMGRRLLVADFPSGLKVGLVHLESLANEALRKQQLATAFATLRSGFGSVLMGDFNFGDGSPESASLDPEFLDTWTTAHPGEPGYTRDTLANPMGRFGREDKRERLDRILVRGLKIVAVEMLGTAPLREGLFASDHFGLLARFTKRP